MKWNNLSVIAGFVSRPTGVPDFAGSANEGKCRRKVRRFRTRHLNDLESLTSFLSLSPNSLSTEAIAITPTTETFASRLDLISVQEQQRQPATTSSTFEPQLDIPALFVFLLVGIIFGLLQFRIIAISNAVNKRIEALQNLRKIKAKQLDKTAFQYDDSLNNETVTDSMVREATESFRNAFEEVERLRVVIPGLARISPPPMDPQRTLETVAAARQFLNINATSVLESNVLEKNSQNIVPQRILTTILILAAVAQVWAWWFFASYNSDSYLILPSF